MPQSNIQWTLQVILRAAALIGLVRGTTIPIRLNGRRRLAESKPSRHWVGLCAIRPRPLISLPARIQVRSTVSPGSCIRCRTSAPGCPLIGPQFRNFSPRKCARKNRIIELVNSRWKAARSKPGWSMQICGALARSPTGQGARKEKCPASGISCRSGLAGINPVTFPASVTIASLPATHSCTGSLSFARPAGAKPRVRAGAATTKAFTRGSVAAIGTKTGAVRSMVGF